MFMEVDVVEREEVNEILQIVDQTSGRNFLVGQPRVVLGGTNAEADDRKKNNVGLFFVFSSTFITHEGNN
jgi:hypothetical protein